MNQSQESLGNLAETFGLQEDILKTEWDLVQIFKDTWKI